MAPAFSIDYTPLNNNTCNNNNNIIINNKMLGKSGKFSMGFGPNNPVISNYPRHALETTADSEGFASSVRLDTEITISEDSCSSPKRKCVSLNGNSHHRFWIPIQVISVSKMSKDERKVLEARLRRELDEVRVLQRRVASFSSASAVVLSPASDIRSCSDGLKRPPLENAPKVSQHPVQGKKQPSLGGRNGARGKKGFPGKVDPRKQGASFSNSNPTAMLMKRCENLLNWLLEHQFAWVFNKPVDVVKLNIPDYFTVIKHPMDLGTVKSKLSRGEYTSPLGFAADVRLTFANAMTYNPPGNDVHFMAQTLSKSFEQRWKAIEKKMSTNADVQMLPAQVHAPVRNEPAVVPNHIPPSKKKVSPGECVGKPEPVQNVKKVMTDDERHKLSMELESLLSELPDSIIDFLKENSSGGEDDEIEIDIDALSDDVLFKLRKLLDDFLLEKKNQTRAEPCEMELHNESGFSNSSIQAEKGNDAVDEDIDIGGGDHPTSSFPPLEIEKDTANKNDRCSSPSSSSSDSGSSSSDSDSRSSGAESEGRKALPPGSKMQSTVDAKLNMDQNQIDIGPEIEQNQSKSGLSLVEPSCQTKPLLVEVDGHKEGESAPSERQVSPDKLYRAALLRSRFADTILKAQEKTLEKVEKRDPEKLRLEREELERRQREEKARLQAEAKAAEEARKKAEAEAAVEAKRKREMEREAARLALQKMEKTVDINENSQFMEDLEMLSAAPDDNLSNFIGDTSPNDSQNGGLGSFRFRGNSNPLEQLGLYRKDDDEEEEEVEAPLNPPDPISNDVEEGEID